MNIKRVIPYLSAIILTAFGLLTLFLSSSIIFDLFGVRAKEGDYVLFIVNTNFICSFIYLIAAYGFLKSKIWTTKILVISVALLITAFIALLIYAYNGGLYEIKTIGAMIFRITITIVFLTIAYFTITKRSNKISS